MSISSKTIALLTICFAILSGCKKNETQEFTDTPIIESYLNTGNYLTVKISRQIPFSSVVNYSIDDINNLTINVAYNNTIHQLTALGDGQYIDSSIVITEGGNYNMSFLFNKKNVSAYTYIPSKPLNVAQSATVMAITQVTVGAGTMPPTSMPTMPDPISITWSNSDASSYLILVENMETTLEAIRDFGDKTPPGNTFKKSPTNSTSSEIRPTEFQYYGTHRVIVYHVLPDYASLYTQTTTSSLNLTNPSTSIVNGYGIFTGLNSDTLFVEVEKN